MSNQEIAELLRSVAAALKLQEQEKNRFRIIAYERASDAIEHLSSEVKDLWDEGKLEEVGGIGKNISSHLGEIFKTGSSKHFDSILKPYPPAMFELMKVPGIGAKTAFKLTKQLGIKERKGAIEKLEKAVKEGKVVGVEGFKEKTQEQIGKSIKEVKGRVKRLTLPYAQTIADEVMEWMKKDSGVSKIDPLGSLRRKVSTIGDIDISVATSSSEKTLTHFTKYSKTKRIVEKGEKTATISLPNGVRVDLMVGEPESYGSLLQHFTGSKHHNIALREYAQKKGLSLSEYGIKKQGTKKKKKFENEESFYKHLGLDWIPPELREDMGEIEAAKDKRLPKLIELKDIKGDFHIHSDFDIETSHDVGESSMEEIAKKVDGLGYEYVALTEHNPSKSGHNEKQIVNILLGKKQAIDKLNTSIKSNKYKRLKYVFNSLEIDILPDGTLPVPDSGMQILDFALVSIHSSFRQSKSSMTERILKGLSHPKVKIFAHPTARKLNAREGVEADWGKIFEYCKNNDKYIEINASPMRLDLPDHLVKDAIEAGVTLSLGTDSHHMDSLDTMEYGVSVARRGWGKPSNIINTRSLEEVKKMLNS